MESGNLASKGAPPTEWFNEFANNVYAFLHPNKAGASGAAKSGSRKGLSSLKDSAGSNTEGDDSDSEEHEPTEPTPKKSRKHRQHAARRSWSPELHQYFTVAWGKLCDAGIRPSPRKIMNIMRDQGAPMEDLTIRQVQSHHQKFKLKLAKQLETMQLAQQVPGAPAPPPGPLTYLLASPAVVDAVLSSSPQSSPVLSRSAQLKVTSSPELTRSPRLKVTTQSKSKHEMSGSAVPPGFVASLMPAFGGPALASAGSSSSGSSASSSSSTSAAHQLSPPSPDNGALGGLPMEDEDERKARLLAADVLAAALAASRGRTTPERSEPSADAAAADLGRASSGPRGRQADPRNQPPEPAGLQSSTSSESSGSSSDSLGSSDVSARDASPASSSSANEMLRREIRTLADVTLSSPAAKRRLETDDNLRLAESAPAQLFRPSSPSLAFANSGGRASPSLPHSLGTLGRTNPAAVDSIRASLSSLGTLGGGGGSGGVSLRTSTGSIGKSSNSLRFSNGASSKSLRLSSGDY